MLWVACLRISLLYRVIRRILAPDAGPHAERMSGVLRPGHPFVDLNIAGLGLWGLIECVFLRVLRRLPALQVDT